jgi:hypothetical protein
MINIRVMLIILKNVKSPQKRSFSLRHCKELTKIKTYCQGSFLLLVLFNILRIIVSHVLNFMDAFCKITAKIVLALVCV